MPAAPTREVWEMLPSAPALVLGSSQRQEVIAASGVENRLEVVRRRSGGGAVLLRPGEVLWLDLILPAGDPLLLEDLGRSFLWLGHTWRQALSTCGVELEIHLGPPRLGPWGKVACFAGLGHGELTLDGAKVLGLSQRRSKFGARFQSALLTSWRPSDLPAHLKLSHSERRALTAELQHCARAVPVARERVLEEFLQALPA